MRKYKRQIKGYNGLTQPELFWWALNAKANGLIRKAKEDVTRTGMTRWCEDREEGDLKMLPLKTGECYETRNASMYQNLQEARDRLCPGASGGKAILPTPCSWLSDKMLNLWCPDLWEGAFLLHQATMFVAICYSSCKKLIQDLWFGFS